MNVIELARVLCIRAVPQVCNVIHTHRQQPHANKISKTAWESLPEQAACCWCMGQELLQLAPVPVQRLEEEWLQAFAEENAAVHVEVQGAILTRGCNDARECSTLRRLLQEHETTSPVPVAVVEMQSLEADKFTLLQKQLDYDLQAIRVAKVKRTNYEDTRVHKRSVWELEQHELSLKAADAFLTSYVADQRARDYMLFKQDSLRKFHVDKEQAVPAMQEFA